MFQVASEEKLLLRILNRERTLSIDRSEECVSVDQMEVKVVRDRVSSHRVVANAQVRVAA